MQQNRGDFFWFLATGLSALAIAVAVAAIFVTDAEHENISVSQAVAVHKADMASRLRKSPAGQP
jgi:hypothetical protein